MNRQDAKAAKKTRMNRTAKTPMAPRPNTMRNEQPVFFSIFLGVLGALAVNGTSILAFLAPWRFNACFLSY
jgi:hypothetical protein